MSTQNGNFADENEFNNNFMSRTVDTSTAGKVALNNVAPESGGVVTNLQRTVNSFASLLGATTGQVYNYFFTWASDIVGAANDTVKARIEAIVAKFVGATGHAHTGVDGDGKAISASSLTSFNKFFTELQSVAITGASGTSFVITAFMTGRIAGGGITSAGVLVAAPYNRCEIRDSLTFDRIEDAGGQKVYCKILWDGTDWQLEFYTNEGGTETAHNYAGPDFLLFFREVFTQETRPTIGAEVGLLDSLDIMLDIPDASATVGGKVTTGTQSFAGVKTFLDQIQADAGAFLKGMTTFDALQDNSTGADVQITNPNSKPMIDLTNAALTSVAMIGAQNHGSLILLANRTGATVQVKHLTGGTAADQIVTPDGLAFDLDDGKVIMLVYLTYGINKWVMISGGGGAGFTNTITDSLTLGAGGSIAIDTAAMMQTWNVAGNAAAVTLGAAPFGTTPPPDGAFIYLIGDSDTNTVTIDHADSADGAFMDGPVTLYKGKTVGFIYSATKDRYLRIG